MDGCLKFVVGSFMVGLVLVAALAIGGYLLYQKYAPAIQSGVAAFSNAQKEIEKIVPGGGFSINSSSVNGKNTVKITVKVPFDPSQGNQAQQVADQISEVIRRNAPPGIPLENLEHLRQPLLEAHGGERLGGSARDHHRRRDDRRTHSRRRGCLRRA